jgi:hypothetical protein
MWLVWVGLNGGYSADVWYPSALVAGSLWSAVVIIGRRLLPQGPAARCAILLFAGLVGLNYLSIAWAASPGSALDAANQLALYLIVAWIFALLPWTPTALWLLVAAWSLGVCTFCIEALVRAGDAPALTPFFVDGRFATPMQYSNATAALAAMTFWPPLVLSARRELPPPIRGLCLGVASFLVGFATLPQSRAALLGLGLVALLGLGVSRRRLRHLVRIIIAGGAAAICLPQAVAVDLAVNAGADVTPVLRHAALVIGIVAVAAVIVGTVVALVDDRLAGRERSPRLVLALRPHRRVLGRVAMAGGVLLAAAAVVVLAPRVGHLIRTVVRAGRTDAPTGSTRLLSASPEERFDYWRVALDLFVRRPLLGIGSGNFGAAYDAARTFVKHSAYTHDLPLRVLSETGAVGEASFVLLVLVLAAGLIRAIRATDELVGALALSVLCVSAYFLFHSLLDWVDEFPALAVPAIALPFGVLTLSSGSRPSKVWTILPARASPAPRRRAGQVGTVAVAVALTVALASGYLSNQLVSRAFAIFRADPAGAYHALSLARSINPLSAQPLTSEGTISLYLGRPDRAQRAFQQSLAREDAWYPRVELALIAASQRRFPPALDEIEQAIRLDRHDPVLLAVQRQILERQRLNPFAINQQLLTEAVATSSAQGSIR